MLIISEPGKVRVIMRDGEPWFVAKDVCAALDIGNVTDVVRGLDDDEGSDFDIIEVSYNGVEQLRNRKIISEPGLYSLIMRSRKPEAKAFKRWITHEVLPSIRKRGVYVPQTAPQIAMPNFADPAAAARAGFNYCPCNHMKRLKGNESLLLTTSPRDMNIIPSAVHRKDGLGMGGSADQYEGQNFTLVQHVEIVYRGSGAILPSLRTKEVPPSGALSAGRSGRCCGRRHCGCDREAN